MLKVGPRRPLSPEGAPELVWNAERGSRPYGFHASRSNQESSKKLRSLEKSQEHSRTPRGKSRETHLEKPFKKVAREDCLKNFLDKDVLAPLQPGHFTLLPMPKSTGLSNYADDLLNTSAHTCA